MLMDFIKVCTCSREHIVSTSKCWCVLQNARKNIYTYIFFIKSCLVVGFVVNLSHPYFPNQLNVQTNVNYIKCKFARVFLWRALALFP